ncbi:hypothetical protein E2C01_001614 [Portunus trituberculatus]|uniref:Uncharacterized protein n=1 Tax=Portunus trituberculatus TaxID=210409 RepID=A0A5B7CMY4_PORTR|nr:hypothetical protein [Portunus trituberculatus]
MIRKTPRYSPYPSPAPRQRHPALAPPPIRVNRRRRRSEFPFVKGMHTSVTWQDACHGNIATEACDVGLRFGVRVEGAGAAWAERPWTGRW